MGNGLGHDVRIAIRGLAASRVISLVAVVTLALAIGANTAVFSVANHLLFRSLPIDAPDRMVSVSSQYAIDHGFKSGAGWSAAMWDGLRERANAFAGALAWAPQQFAVGAPGETDSIGGAYVSGGFFATLGVRAAAGRLLSVDDDRPGLPAGVPAVISHRLWQRRFGGASSFAGAPLFVNGVPVTIAGVIPASFQGLEVGRPFDLALPLHAEPVIRGRNASLFRPNIFQMFVMLRLRDGQSIAAGTTVARTLQPDIVPAGAPVFVQEPIVLVPAAGGAVSVTSPQQVYRQPLLIMLAGVALVLVVACVNIANLLITRATQRRREFSVRLALGASRWRIARLLMIESLVLGAVGGTAGLIVASWGARAIVALSSVAVDPDIDARIFAFATVATLGTAVLFGIVPAYRASRTAPAEVLNAAGRGVVAGAGRLSSGLVAVQIALALVVVLAAGLLVRTFSQLATVPLGFDADRTLIVQVDTARSEGDPARRLDLYQQLASSIAVLPAVTSAAASLWTPLTGDGALTSLPEPGAARGSEGTGVSVPTNFVTPGWFRTYGTAMTAGRDFTSADSLNAPKVVVVNQAFVRRFFDGGPAVGRLIADGLEIVGVAADAVYRSSQRIPGVTSLALREPVPPTMYAALAQLPKWDRPPAGTIRLSVRAARGAPIALAPAVGTAIAAIDPKLSTLFRPLADTVRESLAQERMSATVAASFAVVALLLAVLGLYGVTSDAVSRRRAEIGVRLALGATSGMIVRMILGRAFILIAAGSALGLVAAALLTRGLASQLFGVTPVDLPTFVVLSAVVVTAATIAALVPAWRVRGIEPGRAIRLE